MRQVVFSGLVKFRAPIVVGWILVVRGREQILSHPKKSSRNYRSIAGQHGFGYFVLRQPGLKQLTASVEVGCSEVSPFIFVCIMLETPVSCGIIIFTKYQQIFLLAGEIS